MPRIRRTYFHYAGCMGRRKFLAANLAFAGLAMIAALISTMTLVAIARESGLAPGHALFDGLVAAGAVSGAALVVWAASALVVKRCRDAGVPAWAMLSALFLTPAIDSVLLAPLAHARLSWPLDGMTPLGGAVVASAYLLLLCLPSRKGPRAHPESAAGATRAFG